MRVLVLSNLYPPNVVGGYERLCFDVASALVAAGHQVTVLTSTFGAERAEYPGQRVLRELRLLTGGDIYAPFAGTDEERDGINRTNVATALRVLDEAKPDVVFAWNLFFLYGSLLEAIERHAPRTVLMLTDNWLLVQRNPHFVAEFFRTVVHGDSHFVPPAPSPRPGFLRRLSDRLLGRRTPPGLEAVFGSEFVRDFYAAGGMDFPSHRVVHNGVRQIPDPAGAPDRTRLVRPGTLRLLFAGRLVDLKGAHTAVDAMPLLGPLPGALTGPVAGVDRVELTLLGDAQDTAYMPVLHDAIARSGCAGQIHLRPTVPEADLPALFAEHDIYLFPSLYEPFSLTLIHAMALGIPTVASRAGGNTEIVTDGESGLLFPKGDAAALAACVARLAKDGALRARIAAGGQRSAARFTFDRMVAGMTEFLQPAGRL